jgi:hypothetical protein
VRLEQIRQACWSFRPISYSNDFCLAFPFTKLPKSGLSLKFDKFFKVYRYHFLNQQYVPPEQQLDLVSHYGQPFNNNNELLLMPVN